jgi:glycosyltransferase involved in cell wall biosynthesis
MPGSDSISGADLPMRVLHLLPPPIEPGTFAPYSFLQEEIEALDKAGVEIYIISTATDREEMHGNVRVIPVPPGAGLSGRCTTLRFLAEHVGDLPSNAFRQFRRTFHSVRIEKFAATLIEKYQIDLIHSHFGPSIGLGGVLAKRATGCPLIATFRGMDVLADRSIGYGLRLDGFYDQALRKVLQHADRSTFWSEYTRAAALDLGAPEDNAMVIRKGVDLSRFRPASDRLRLRADLGIHSPMILAVGGLIKRKGMDTIIRAAGLLKKSYEFTLVIAGEGRQAEALVELTEELDLTDRVRFVGRLGRDEIPRYFAACDTFILASRMEASGNVVFEAMASARPVVCTDSGGPPEYVRDGKTGYIVPVGDHVRMAERIALLLDAPELADRLGRAGRAVAERELVYENMTRAFLQLYEELTVRHATDSTPIKASA